MKAALYALLISSAFSQLAGAQTNGGHIDFESYDPLSSLVVPEHKVTRAKFPFIDVHNHQGNMPNQDIPALLRKMDSLNMRIMVNLSGRGFRNNNGVFDINEPHCTFYQCIVCRSGRKRLGAENRAAVGSGCKSRRTRTKNL